MRPLVPAVPDAERLAFCLFLALAVHGVGILGVVFSPPRAEAPPDFDVFWAGGVEWPSVRPEEGEGMPWPAPSHPTLALARGREGQTREAYTLEQEYVRQWVVRTESLGSRMVESLDGEIVVHVTMDAQGAVRRFEVEPGPESLAHAARRIVIQSQPHAPFSEALRSHRDRLRISRRWLFGETAGLRTVEAHSP